MKKGILFDYNGVIVHDEHLQEQAMAAVVRAFGGTLTPEDYIEHFLGRTDDEGFEHYRLRHPLVFDNTPTRQLRDKKFIAYENLVATQSILFPGIKNVFEKLSKLYSLGIVTAAFSTEVLPILEEEGIRSYFKALITADDTSRGKPDPEGYLKGVAALDLPKKDIVVIEDSPRGVHAAKTAGLKCIAVLHTTSKENLTEADATIEKITDITEKVIETVFAE